MHFGADPIPAEQHDAEKRGFEKKSRQHLKAEKRADDIADLVRKDRPIGAELIRHDHTGNDSHAEGYRKYLDPHTINVFVNPVSGLQQPPLDDHQPTGQADRESGKDDVKRYRKGELNTSQ